MTEAERVARLTQTELRVVRHLSFGMTAKDIGARLGQSTNTTRTHIQNILVKLHTHSQAGAVGMVNRVQQGETPFEPSTPSSSPPSSLSASPPSSLSPQHTWKDDWTKMRSFATDWVRMAAVAIGRGRHVGPTNRDTVHRP